MAWIRGLLGLCRARSDMSCEEPASASAVLGPDLTRWPSHKHSRELLILPWTVRSSSRFFSRCGVLLAGLSVLPHPARRLRGWRPHVLRSDQDSSGRSFNASRFMTTKKTAADEPSSASGDAAAGAHSASLFQPRIVFPAAVLLRVVLFFYGLWQDANSPMKYTDIDYYVFTDAARFVSQGGSPYDRETYRYTPLLAWLLLPSVWSPWTFSFGKALFAVADIVTGWLIVRVLATSGKMREDRAAAWASVWLLNPMVATISTRGSSEGLLGVMMMLMLWAIAERRIKLAAVALGAAVHFKIYPFIYGASILWWLEGPPVKDSTLFSRAVNFLNADRIVLVTLSLSTFMGLNFAMYYIYGSPFIQHTYLHHVTRIDHRHNFSPYNTMLYLSSSPQGAGHHIESFAFIPQLLLSAVLIPLATAKKDLYTTFLAQTFAFVAFNKVCTSQYFLWFMVFLPFYLPKSSLLSQPVKGLVALTTWVLAQAWWLYEGYQLEFLGQSTFIPGLWASSTLFFVVNICILGVILSDISSPASATTRKS